MPSQFTFSKNWHTPTAPDLPRIVDSLRTLGLAEADAENGQPTFRGGSQLRMRLLGGWFISPRHLPKRVRVTTTGGEDGPFDVTVLVEDALGTIAVRDSRFEGRYEMAADEVFAAVEEELGPSTAS